MPSILELTKMFDFTFYNLCDYNNVVKFFKKIPSFVLNQILKLKLITESMQVFN